MDRPSPEPLQHGGIGAPRSGAGRGGKPGALPMGLCPSRDLHHRGPGARGRWVTHCWSAGPYMAGLLSYRRGAAVRRKCCSTRRYACCAAWATVCRMRLETRVSHSLSSGIPHWLRNSSSGRRCGMRKRWHAFRRGFCGADRCDDRSRRRPLLYGRLAQAAALFVQGLDHARDRNIALLVASALIGLAGVAAASEQPATGAALLGAAEGVLASSPPIRPRPARTRAWPRRADGSARRGTARPRSAGGPRAVRRRGHRPGQGGG